MNDKKLLVVLAFQAVIIALLGTLAVLQYITLQHTPKPITWATLRDTKDEAERVRLVQSLPMVRVHDIDGTVDVDVQDTVNVDVQNTVDVDVQNTPLEVESY